MSKRKPYRPAPQPAQSAAVTSPSAIQEAPVQEAAAAPVQEAAAVPEEELFIQYGENEVAASEISAKVKEDYRQSGNEDEIRQVKIYVKPEENKAYYVINDVEGNVDLFLSHRKVRPMR